MSLLLLFNKGPVLGSLSADAIIKKTRAATGPLVYDSFSGSSTALASHTPDIGGTWSSCDLQTSGSGALAGVGSYGTYLSVQSGSYSDVDARLKFWWTGGPPGAAIFVVRYQVSGTYYAIFASGTNQLIVAKYLNGSYNSGVASATGISFTVGQSAYLRIQVVGSSPTILRAKVWLTTDTEPSSWGIDTSDNSAQWQVASGKMGIALGTSNGVAAELIDDYTIREYPTPAEDALTANAVLKKPSGTKSLTADAIVKRIVSGSLTANAVCKVTKTSSFTANSVVRKSQSGSFGVDAYITRPAAVYSLTVDAWIRRTTSGSYTLGSTLKKTQAGSFTANADIKRSQAGKLTSGWARWAP